MGKGRTVVSIVAIALLMGLLGACGSGSSKSSATSQSALTAQVRAARAKVELARRRLAAARARVIAQRHALAAAVRRRQLQAKAAAKRAQSTTTSSPAVSKVGPTGPGPSGPPAQGAAAAADLAAIQRAIDTVNAGFAKGVVTGIAASEATNYYIRAGVYTDGQCSAFEAARGLGVVADRFVVHAGSIVPAPGWIDPVLHAVPSGRVYALTKDDIQTQVMTKEQRTQAVATHATVRSDGHAELFFRCE
jgi:hypothetical protein